jgi:hypothetical protein
MAVSSLFSEEELLSILWEDERGVWDFMAVSCLRRTGAIMASRRLFCSVQGYKSVNKLTTKPSLSMCGTCRYTLVMEYRFNSAIL